MLSSWYPIDSIANLRINTLWDGIFHSFTYVLIVRASFCSGGRPRIIVSWTRCSCRCDAVRLGVFNVVEGWSTTSFGDPPRQRDSAARCLGVVGRGFCSPAR